MQSPISFQVYEYSVNMGPLSGLLPHTSACNLSQNLPSKIRVCSPLHRDLQSIMKSLLCIQTARQAGHEKGERAKKRVVPGSCSCLSLPFFRTSLCSSNLQSPIDFGPFPPEKCASPLIPPPLDRGGSWVVGWN